MYKILTTMIRRKPNDEKWEKVLKKYHPITEQTAKEAIEIIEPLLLINNEFRLVSIDIYAQMILSLGEAYRLSGDIEEAIRFLEEQIKKFSSIYDYAYSLKSDMFHHLGVYYALMLNREKATEAFRNHIFYFMFPNQTYNGFEFYSYRSYNEFTLADLQNNTLTLASPKTFNDPMDCLIFPWFDFQKKKAQNDGEKLAAELLIEVYSYIKIRCFRRNKPLPSEKEPYPTSKSDIGEQYEPLMWAHYANGHKGFCVKYAFPSSLTPVEKSKCTDKMELTFLGNVEYENSKNLSENLNMTDAFFKKSNNWSYECEVRLIHFDPTWKGDYKPIKLPLGCVKEVYFGLKCSEENKQAIRDALVGQRVKFFQIETQPHDFYKLTSREV